MENVAWDLWYAVNSTMRKMGTRTTSMIRRAVFVASVVAGDRVETVYRIVDGVGRFVVSMLVERAYHEEVKSRTCPCDRCISLLRLRPGKLTSSVQDTRIEL